MEEETEMRRRTPRSLMNSRPSAKRRLGPGINAQKCVHLRLQRSQRPSGTWSLELQTIILQTKKLTLIVAKHPAVSSVDLEHSTFQGRHGLVVEDDGEQLEKEASADDADEEELDEIEGNDDDMHDVPSFLQLRGAQAPKHVAAARRKAKRAAVDYLLDKAKSLKSKRLSAIVSKLKLGKDHFVKVRSIIKDLIAKLKADALAEATQKTYCDEEMKTATEMRDEAVGEIEDHTASIDASEIEDHTA